MRIVGGAWRGRALSAPPGRATRPTSDRVREAMFDVLLAMPELRRVAAAAESGEPGGASPGPAIGPLAGHAVLDLFAGSGALGLEALSRGAAGCTFVESAALAVKTLRGNLERLGVPLRRPGAPAAASGASGATGLGGPPEAVASRSGPLPASRQPQAGCHAVVLVADVRRALAADARREARYTLVFADPPYERYEEVRPALVRLLGRVLVPGAVLVVETGARSTAGLPWRVVREKRYGDTRVTFLVADGARPAEGEAADDDRPAT